MYRQYPLHHYAPHHHKQRQPAIGGVASDEAHIPWRDEVEQHDGWHVPERQLVVQPEVPVDGYVADQVDHVLREPLRSEVVGQVERRGADEPCGQYADESAAVEVAHRRRLCPREPQTHATQEEEDVNPHVATATQPVERVAAVECHMEQNDEEHCCSHLFGAKSRYVS